MVRRHDGTSAGIGGSMLSGRHQATDDRHAVETVAQRVAGDDD
jgi:hypothetical protein